MSGPIQGIADIRFVITVAPHNDICPYGSTYPRNAVAIISTRMITPMLHRSVRGDRYDP